MDVSYFRDGVEERGSALERAYGELINRAETVAACRQDCGGWVLASGRFGRSVTGGCLECAFARGLRIGLNLERGVAVRAGNATLKEIKHLIEAGVTTIIVAGGVPAFTKDVCDKKGVELIIFPRMSLLPKPPAEEIMHIQV